MEIEGTARGSLRNHRISHRLSQRVSMQYTRSSQREGVDTRKSNAEDAPNLTEVMAEALERLDEIEISEDNISAKVAP
jgi:hypothetical protein